MQENLYFYYTNDFHSNFVQWPKVTRFLKEVKAKRESTGESYWIVDIGDHVDRVHPITEAFMGQANIQLMNELDYTLATLGNNEGITLPYDDLYHLYDQANFQVVCANLKSEKLEDPDWLLPFVHKKSIHGVRVGIIGLTAPYYTFYELLGWKVSLPTKILAQCIEELRESTDIIILLSHLGLNEDREIARNFSDIDVIIGGHTHHLLRTGEHINETILTAAGKHCSFVGEVILTWDHSLNRLVEKQAYATDITHLVDDMETVDLLTMLNKEADRRLAKEIVYLEFPLKVDWFQTTPLIEGLANTLKTWTNADCAMLNAGLLLHDLERGSVTKKDIHSICPHPINPCTVELYGDELMEVIRVAYTKELTEYKLVGLGFRGKVVGKMIFAGLEIETNMYADGQISVKNVQLNGQLLENEKLYTLGTIDTFTFARLFPEIVRSPVKQYFLPEFLRDLLEKTLKEME